MAKMTRKTDLGGLTLLGRRMRPSKKLETFPNHHPGRDYTVTLKTDEFTCVCPKTGQPDFAKLTIQYIPDQKIVESKSLKLYLWVPTVPGGFFTSMGSTPFWMISWRLCPRGGAR